MKRAAYWLIDTLYLFNGRAKMFFHRNPPKHYLGYVVKGKNPVILLPGIANKWGFIKNLGDRISLAGHPVYIVPKLGYNLHDIPKSAKIVAELIEENNLKNVIIVGHSKGGLIGKYLMIYNNENDLIKGVVAIASPFSGSRLLNLLPHKAYSELHEDSDLIKNLMAHKEVNGNIISIFPVFDNLILSSQGSYLEGAENIEIKEAKGHHKIIFHKKVTELVLTAIEKLSKK